MEYYITPMLDYFEDTLANVVYPEAWLNRTKMMRLKSKKCVKCELNRIGKNWVKFSQKLWVKYSQIRWVKSKNQVKHGDKCGTSDADVDASIGYLIENLAVSWHSGRVLVVIEKSENA